jgi:hypothetical protein
MLKEKVKKQIANLALDLSGKVVLTEAATGPYVVTALFAAFAGAEVYAYTRSTRYGTADEVFEQTREILKEFGDLNIHLIKEISPEIIAKADIITNSGHLRPLSKEKLQYAKESVVMPLMYEAWEWRDADLDLDYCRERGIKVGATNERHPDVDVFNFLGDMSVKFIFDAGLCLYRNKFVLLCNNDFGPYIAKVISRMCDGLGVIDKAENRHKYNLENVEWLSDFPEINIPEKYRDSEAIIFTAYPFDQSWIENEGPVSLEAIKAQFNDPFVLRYAGDINPGAFDAAGVRYYPQKVHSGHMGIIPSEIGWDPIIRLQSGGLKVAELMLKGETHYKGELLVDIV